MDNNNEYYRIYYEIAKGYSKVLFKKKEIYFKHPTFADYFSVYANYDLIINFAKQNGVETEVEKLEEAILNNWWTKEKEEKFIVLKKTIKNLIDTKNKLVFKSQKKEIEKEIRKTESILLTYSKERKDIIGYTAEQYAQERFFDEILINSLCEDQDLNIKYFKNEDDFYSIDEEDNSLLRNLYTKYSACFSQETIKVVAANGFFQNLVYLDTIPNTFWGQPVVKCSKYQIDLLLYGKMLKSTIDSYIKNGKPIADHIVNDPEKLVEWFDSLDSSKGSQRSRRKSSGKNMVTSYVGATPEDLQELGVKPSKIQGKSLLELAAEKGGVLEKNDYLSLREK